MANPLQPKVIKCLEQEYDAFVVNITSSTKSGVMDVVACIPRPRYFQAELEDGRYPDGPMKVKERVGLFYGFEVKWKTDTPSELQKQKINQCLDAGGRAYFIRSVEQLRNILDNSINPIRYDLKNRVEL